MSDHIVEKERILRDRLHRQLLQALFVSQHHQPEGQSDDGDESDDDNDDEDKLDLSFSMAEWFLMIVVTLRWHRSHTTSSPT